MRSHVTKIALATAILASAVAISAQKKELPPKAAPAKDFVIPTPKRFTLANGCR